MGKGSFLFGLALGSTATAAVILCFFLDPRRSDDDEDDDKMKKTQLQQLNRRRGNSHRQTQSAMGRVNPETSFFTDVMAELWSHIKVAAADTVQSTVEPYFRDMPPPMNTCRFVKVDLGDVPITMNNIVVHPIQKQNDAVQWDFDMEWDGECDIQLRADYIGRFGIQKLKLFGRMAVIFKPLTNELPVVSCIQYSFINMPQVDLKFTGLASVAEMSVLNDSIKAALQGSMLSSCLPYRRMYKMSADNNFLDTYVPPVGVLRLSVETGRGFVIEKRLLLRDDIPDVYLNVSLGATTAKSETTWRTKTIMDDCNPKWNVTKDFLLWDRTQKILVHAWDEDDGPLDPDDDLGSASISVIELLLSPHRRKELPLHVGGKEIGAFVTLSCSIGDWTAKSGSLSTQMVTTSETEAQLNGSLTTSKSRHSTDISGLLIIIINRAFDLPINRETAATFVKAKFAGKEYDSSVIFDSPGYYDALNPVYDSAFTIPLSRDMKIGDDATIELVLIDAGKDDRSNVVGSISLVLGDLKKHPDNTLTERRKLSSDSNSDAALEFRVSLSGVTIPEHQPETVAEFMEPLGELTPGSSSPTKTLMPPTRLLSPRHDTLDEDNVIGALGTLRMTVVSGEGLKIEQQLFEVAIPDCYCVVHIGPRAFRTTVKHNTVKPTWEEHKDFPLDDHGDVVKLEVWDMNEEVIGNGILLGDASTTIGKLLMAGRSTELEVQKGGRGSGIFITLKCEMVA